MEILSDAHIGDRPGHVVQLDVLRGEREPAGGLRSNRAHPKSKWGHKGAFDMNIYAEHFPEFQNFLPGGLLLDTLDDVVVGHGADDGRVRRHLPEDRGRDDDNNNNQL